MERLAGDRFPCWGWRPAMVIPSASLLKFGSFGLQDHSLVSSGPLLLNRRASDSHKGPLCMALLKYGY